MSKAETGEYIALAGRHLLKRNVYNMSFSLFWLIALVVFGVIEAVTVGLASIWFAIGALAALIVSFFVGVLWVQIIVFLVVSFVALAAIRPFAKKLLVPKTEATNADRVIGAEAVVTQTIDNLKGEGAVTVGGVPWTARADRADQIIPKGTTVHVLRIEGVKLFVTEEENAHE